MLPHHKLNVYEKALAFGAEAEELSASWGRRHSIVEHFCRASESISGSTKFPTKGPTKGPNRGTGSPPRNASPGHKIFIAGPSFVRYD
jgi:hypothetical protein